MVSPDLEFIEEAGGDKALVLLHGYGADAHDLLPLGALIAPGRRVVSLQAPLQLGGMSRAWFHLMQDARGIAFDPRQAREGLRLATEAVERIAASSPAPLLLGFSQGAAMALGVLLTRPELVEGVLALSGVPPVLDEAEFAPAERLRGKPVFAAHGAADPLVPVELGRSTRDELLRRGLAVEWREYPAGHMVAPQELEDARAWVSRLSASSSSR